MRHTISVIIPTYNRAHYIASAVESVLSQNLPKGYGLEVLVIDDGSTDNTGKVLKKFGDQIIYKKIKHSGLPAVPRNVGIKVAKGELIAFQDSDDLWAKDKLIKQVPVFTDEKVVLSFGNTKAMSAKGTKKAKATFDSKQLRQGEKFENLISSNVVSTLTVMARKKVLDELGGFDENPDLKAVEDYELWLRIAARYPGGLKSIPEVLAYYRIHEHNISVADDLKALEQIMRVQESVYDKDQFAKPEMPQQLLKALNTTYRNWSRLKNEREPETKPKVSVVMSVYNGAKHLRKSIEGILGQTFKDFEFIIIDDGSTDSSAKIIKSYKDKRIRLIQQTNHGLVYSLNKGVGLARGELIARQDADDISLPERLEKEVALFNENPGLGLVGTFFTYFDEKTEKPGLTITMPTKSLDIKRALYITNPIGHGTAMYRKSIFESLGPYTNDYGPTEDFELWRRIADRWEIAIIPESLYLYRLSPTSISHTKSDIQHANTAKIIEEQWAKPFLSKPYSQIVGDGKFYKSHGSPFASLIFDQYAAHTIDIGKALFEQGSFRKALPTSIAAIRLKPKSAQLFFRPAIRGSMRKLKRTVRFNRDAKEAK